ncbi:MAG: D-cysteine desulfhydrase [Planctomycetota bacterium]|nr:MAG: D-cysteine desulfhydrase [Planctomycetota bacterium]
MHLDQFPRVKLCHRPTPLERMERLSEHLGGPQLFVKRDDCTGLAVGGNKTRKLEFLMAEAIEQGANTVVTIGGVQSNHCRQTTAAAAKLGLKCELVLPHLSRYCSESYETGGNLFLDRLLGAEVHIAADVEAAAIVSRDVMSQIRKRGDVPFFIPAGGSTATGALGYVDAAWELARQAAEQQLRVDHLVITTGSCTTHAGLIVGFESIAQSEAFDCDPSVIGISVYHPREKALATVRQKVRETAQLVGLEADLDDQVLVRDDYLGSGYGEPTDAMIEAVTLAARYEGLLLDPVYTGKTFSGLVDLVRQGFFDSSENVLFWHTGGTPALFVYRDAFEPSPAPDEPAERFA